jgi:hypothetical protein
LLPSSSSSIFFSRFLLPRLFSLRSPSFFFFSRSIPPPPCLRFAGAPPPLSFPSHFSSVSSFFFLFSARPPRTRDSLDLHYHRHSSDPNVIHPYPRLSILVSPRSLLPTPVPFPPPSLPPRHSPPSSLSSETRSSLRRPLYLRPSFAPGFSLFLPLLASSPPPSTSPPRPPTDTVSHRPPLLSVPLPPHLHPSAPTVPGIFPARPPPLDLPDASYRPKRPPTPARLLLSCL